MNTIASEFAKLAERLASVNADARALGRLMIQQAFPGDAGALTRSVKNTIENGRRIGRAGWTFPMDATPREIDDLLRQAETEDIDAIFVRYYDDEDARRFGALKSRLRSTTELERWLPLIEQAFTAYESNLYLVVVPAMITVVEGTIAQAGGWEAWASTTIPRIAGQLRERTFPNSISLAVSLSVEAFIAALFLGQRFDAARPERLNRHWILHGRDHPDWSKADCLRLFQAVNTIAG